MWLTPSSTARRSTARAMSRSAGGPHTCGPGSCIAPKPMRDTWCPANVALPAGISSLLLSSIPDMTFSSAVPGCYRFAKAEDPPNRSLSVPPLPQAGSAGRGPARQRAGPPAQRADELLALRDPDVALRTCCAGSAVDQREQAGRMLDLLMDGLRARTARQVSE